MKFELVEIDRADLLSVEHMRNIRNTCRPFMTRDRKFLTFEDQALWWEVQHTNDPERKTWKPMLLWLEHGFAESGVPSPRDRTIAGTPIETENGVRYPIGYGIVWHGSRIKETQVVSQEARTSWWLSGGILPEWRGAGYGRFLFDKLVELAGGACWLEVRADNAPARALYAGLGFETIAATDDIITMRRRS